jgi:hypothetical protein
MFEANRPYLHLETPLVAESITLKTAQFLQGSNVQDASASNADGVLWKDTCVSSS